MDLFWEINTWANPEKPSTGMGCFVNHTLTRRSGSSVYDADPLWPGHIFDGVGGLTMVIPLPCCEVSGPTVWWSTFSFPRKDSHKEFWSYGINLLGRLTIFIFALTPHIADELYQAEVVRIGRQHGVHSSDLNRIQKVRWPADYKPGDGREESTNHAGQGATLHSEYKARPEVGQQRKPG